MELKQFIVFATFFCILRSATGQRLLPCDSTFRFLRPDLFDHCTTCRHSDWTEWKQVPNSVGVDKSANVQVGRHTLNHEDNTHSWYLVKITFKLVVCVSHR